MSFRHAAALALVGWYLMSPPVMRIPRMGLRVNPTASMGYWKIRGTYQSLFDCEDAKRAMLTLAEGDPANMPDAFADLSPLIMRAVTQSSVCISSDDPRLIGKVSE